MASLCRCWDSWMMPRTRCASAFFASLAIDLSTKVKARSISPLASAFLAARNSAGHASAGAERATPSNVNEANARMKIPDRMKPFLHKPAGESSSLRELGPLTACQAIENIDPAIDGRILGSKAQAKMRVAAAKRG